MLHFMQTCTSVEEVLNKVGIEDSNEKLKLIKEFKLLGLINDVE